MIFNNPMRHAPRERRCLPASATPALLRKLGAPANMQTFVRAEPSTGDADERARIEWEASFAKEIVVRLQHHYPGHAWECAVDARHGGAQLRIAILMTGPQCYFMRFDDLATVNEFNRRVRDAGGELLERFRIPRSTFDINAYVAARPKAVFHQNMKVPE